MVSHFFRPATIAASIALGTSLTTPVALALGMGSPTLTPTIGAPLRIEIPLLLSPGEKLPATGCAYLSVPRDAPDRQFFPAQARVVVDTTAAPRIVIVSPQTVTEPLIEFRLTLGCNNDLSRDYLILTDPPQAPRTAQLQAAPAPVLPEPVTTPAPPPRQNPPPPAPSAASVVPPVATKGETITLAQSTNLNALARELYPASQTTRDEYRMLMARANPALFVGQRRTGSVPLPAGTVLVIPDNLPPAEDKVAAKTAPAATSAPRQKKPAAEPPKAAASAPRKDRLVVGGDKQFDVNAMNPRQMSAAVERMERMIEDQGRTEVKIAENLTTLNFAFIEAKKYIESLEAAQKKALIEQRALQSRVERAEARVEKTPGIWELLALIIASGSVGAGLLMLHHRLQARRHAVPLPATEATVATVTTAATPETPAPPPIETSVVARKAAPLSQPPASPRPPSPSPSASRPVAPPAQPAAVAIPTSSPARPAAVAVPPSAPARPAAVAVQPPRPAAPAVPEPSVTARRAESPTPPPPQVPAPPPVLDFELLPASEAGNHAADELRQTVDPAHPPLFFTAESVSHKNSALELAAIMESMGLIKEAADALVEHLARAPKEDLGPWLKALNIYRKTGQREAFEALARQLHKELNVEPHAWDFDPDAWQPRSLIEFQRIIAPLQELWKLDDKSECAAFLRQLLTDNRESTRNGFPQEVAEEIALLLKVLDTPD